MTAVRTIYAALLVALVACAGVLGLKRGASEVFPHRAHVTKGVSCTRCHEGMEKDTGVLHLPDASSCKTCHDKPVEYPPSEVIAQLVESRDHLKFDHGKHLQGDAKGNCMRCHTGVAEGDRAMRPAMATCFNCHAHGEARDARRCETCHKDLAEEGTLPASHLAHDGNWMREHGTRAASSGDLCATCHKESFCAECHGVTAPAIPAKLRFMDPFAASVHRANFAARHSLEAKAQPGLCTTCHQQERCASCHLARGVAGDTVGSPHPRGWVGLTASENLHGREARRDPAACASCHGGAGEQLCVSCHKVGGVGGNPHPAGWSSRQSLSSLPCRMCHPNGRER